MLLNPSSDELIARAVQLEREGRNDEAILAYETLLESWPGLPNCWFNLGVLQRKQGRFDAALKSYAEALERGVDQPEEVHLNRGVVFSDGLRRYDAAEREIRKALALNPVYVPALMNYANLFEDAGERALAASVYEQILMLVPEAPQVLARYAGLKAFADVDDPMIARLRSALAKPGISAHDAASLEFALGKALDECRSFDDAFESYRAANRHSRQGAAQNKGEYELRTTELNTRRMIAAFPKKTYPSGVLTEKQPQPVFVCGMFRSGSTLTEQLLAGHPRIDAGGEFDFLPRAVNTLLNPFPESMHSVQREQVIALADEYQALLHTISSDAAFVTDKRPDNFLYIGLIKALFPRAKIVHTMRDALDNCLSIYFLHLDQGMSYALDLMDIGHYYREYLRLMAHWKLLFGDDIIDVDYDALVTDPESQIAPALAALHLEWDERCRSVPPLGRRIKTASVWQVREPLHLRSSGRSKHYARHVDALREYISRPL